MSTNYVLSVVIYNCAAYTKAHIVPIFTQPWHILILKIKEIEVLVVVSNGHALLKQESY